MCRKSVTAAAELAAATAAVSAIDEWWQWGSTGPEVEAVEDVPLRCR